MDRIDRIDRIIDRYVNQEGVLIQLLLDIQRELNWVPKEAILRINERLKFPVSQIYRVASFYKAMSLTPVGRHLIRVCLGTACHVRGGQRLVDKLERDYGIRPGETTEDMKFTLETVNCLGCCALGPVAVVDGKYESQMNPEKLDRVMKNCR